VSQLKPYLILSDLHLHAWSAFSTVNSDGVNSRLRIILNEIHKAAMVLKEADGNEIFCAGDLFHVRGKLAPTVLTPTLDAIRYLTEEEGMSFTVLPGNHDLENKTSDRIGSALNSLAGVGALVIDKPELIETESGRVVLMVPWQPTKKALFEILRQHSGEAEVDAIIHAPLDNVLPNIPPSGITDTELANLGLGRVFVGHYHNHRDFGNGVYSIGALTHQTWADVGTKAGYLLVYPDQVEHYETDAPKFVRVSEPAVSISHEDIQGNYIKVDKMFETAMHVEALRADLESLGAAGISINPIHGKPTVTRAGVTVSGVSMEQSIAEFIQTRGYADMPGVAALAQEILEEARSN